MLKKIISNFNFKLYLITQATIINVILLFLIIINYTTFLGKNNKIICKKNKK